MCGIVGFTGYKKAAPILLDGLERLEYRGYDSAGIAVVNSGKITAKKTIGRIKGLVNSTNFGLDFEGNIGIGHTRWATHGAPTEVNAHPHLSQNGRFAVVHNGIIENYMELRAFLKSRGYDLISNTDTEVIPFLIDYFYEGDLLTAVQKAVEMLEGSYALGIICPNDPNTLIAARKSSPLIIGVAKNGMHIASDITALISHTKNVIYLEDGEIAVLKPESATVYNENGNMVKKEISLINWNVAVAEKGGYNHFMMKEIMEQPKAVESTILPRIKNGKIILDDFHLTADEIKNINRIVITACGSASYAGQVGKYVLEELLRKPVEVDLASELRYRNPIIDEHTLLIVISQSGETADTIAALKEAKKRGARVLSIVNVVGSTIAKLSHNVLYTWAGPEIAVATTKGYTTQLAVLYLFGIYCAKLLSTKSPEEISALINDVLTLPQKMQQAIDINKNIEEIAKKYYAKRNIFFIGRNIDAAVALEGSLKLKEISYIHSEAYAAGELKHGTISLIEEGRLVVALSCYNHLFDKLMSNVKEVKARGATVLGVCTESNTNIKSEVNDVIYVPDVNPLFIASCEIIPLQLFAYYVAQYNGCDIDKPKNLAKSVTVE